MALPEKSVSGMTAIGALALTDIIYAVDDPGGSPLSRKATLQQVADVVKTGFAGQIPFPATQNPSADANTLDDYEEGTWTPTILATTSGSIASYGTQSGIYTKIGNKVFIEFDIGVSNKGDLAGNLYIGGLPFAVGAGVAGFTVLFYYSTVPLVSMLYHPSSTYLFIAEAAISTYTIATEAILSDTFQIRCSLNYNA